MNQSINYFSDGHKLWANLAIPDRHQPGEKHPGIIECPGFQHGVTDPESRPANLRERNRVNQTLLEEGYVILSPHCRGMGRSQGRTGYLEYPKTRVNPFEQAADLMNGITYLQSREEVDPDRIGAWGGSFGGALAPYIAATDRRVSCCVAVTGFADGEEWMRRIRRDWEFQEFRKRVAQDLRQQVLTGQPTFVPPDEILLLPPEEVQATSALRDSHANLRFSLDSAHYIMKFKPLELAHRISCPFLVIGAEKDQTTPYEEFIRIYDHAPDPKKLVTLPNVSHYTIYAKENIDKLVQPLVGWFKQWLPAR